MRLDDDAYLDTPSHSIGEIKLVVDRTTKPKTIRKTKKKSTIGSEVTPPHSSSQKIHERSKKGTFHRVKYVASVI